MLSFSSVLDCFRRGAARRSSVRALRNLSAAQLRDIGVAPDHIGEVVDAMVDSGWSEAERLRLGPARPGMPLSRQAAEVSCG